MHRRSVYEVGYVVTSPSNRDSPGTIRVLASNGLLAANTVVDQFPTGWWSASAACGDTLRVESVKLVCGEIALEAVEGTVTA